MCLVTGVIYTESLTDQRHSVLDWKGVNWFQYIESNTTPENCQETQQQRRPFAAGETGSGCNLHLQLFDCFYLDLLEFGFLPPCQRSGGFDNTMSGPTPNLSQYFGNTASSFFEEIARKFSVAISLQVCCVIKAHSFLHRPAENPPQNAAQTPPSASISTALTSSTSTTASPNIQQHHPPQSPSSPAQNIPDDVKDQWEPPPLATNANEPGARPHRLTLPGVQLATDLTDPIRQAVAPLLGEAEAQRRRILGADDVTQDERGLRQLIEAGSLRAAVNLTGRLLTIYGQGYGRAGQPAKHSPHSLQLWFTRFALLMKLGMYEVCQAEAEPFGQLNRADVYFEHSPEMYATRRGSMAPFSLRLLLAELPMYRGSAASVAGAKQALDRLTEMYLVCKTIVAFYEAKGPTASGAAAYAFWLKRQQRVVHGLVNCALLMKDYNMTDALIAKLADGPELQVAEKKALYSAWGRVYLQCGDVFGAERKFLEARRIRDG